MCLERGIFSSRQVISLRRMRPCPLYTPPVAATDWMSYLCVRMLEAVNHPTLTGWLHQAKVLFNIGSRGSRSRNKVIVGEPAFGSLLLFEMNLKSGSIDLTFGFEIVD